MNWRTTLILLVIAAAAVVYIKFFESKRPNTEEAARQARNIVNIEQEKIDRIEITNGDDKIEIVRAGDKWRLEAPIKDQADTSGIDSLLMDLSNWQKDGTIAAKEIEADKNKLEEFGLNKTRVRLKLTGRDAPPEIWFGKEAALEGQMYVRFANSKEVYLASQSIKTAITKKPDEFRDKKLTDLTSAQIAKALVKTPAGEIELQKTNNQWDIVKPMRARGDAQKIGDLISQVTAARIQQFVAEDGGDLQPYGLAQPRGSITVFSADDKSGPRGDTDSSRGEQGRMLQIGNISEKEKEQVYVRFSPRSFVYTLPKKVEDVLKTQVNDLRDRNLLRFDTNVLDRITIEAPGKAKTILARKDENWTIASRNNTPANNGEVRRLIETLGSGQITKFVEDVASDLPKYGLDKPQLQVTLSSFASENTAETKAGEQPLTSVAFGKQQGEDVFARVGDEPFIVAVRRTLLDDIFADPLQWQELAIFKFKPEEIHTLSVATTDEITIARGPENKWTWVKGSGDINQTNVQSLLNTLSKLSAVRWVGATVPQHGFDKPQLTITFTTSPDDKAVHKLVIGAPSGNGMWFARSDEREGTFVVNNPDLNALKLLLVNPPAPTSPAPGQSPVPPPAPPVPVPAPQP